MISDSNIKKVIIPKSELPAISSANFSYNVRFRVISEDKNRSSHWSNIYNIEANPISTTSNYAITTDNVNRVVNLVWNPGLDLSGSYFDIYIKWVGQAGTESNYSYEYAANTINNFYSTVHPENLTDPLNPLTTTPTKKVRMLVQRPTYPKKISASATLFETPLHTI